MRMLELLLDPHLPAYKRKYKARRDSIRIEPGHSARSEHNGKSKQTILNLTGYWIMYLKTSVFFSLDIDESSMRIKTYEQDTDNCLTEIQI